VNNTSDMAQMIPQAADYIRILPEIVLALFGMLIMVLDPLMDEHRSQKTLGALALVGALGALVATLFQSQYRGLAFWSMVQVDSFSLFFHFLVAAVTAVVILSSYEYMAVQEIRAGEYYALVLFATVGMMFLACGYDLISLYISLELMALTFYVLVAFTKREKRSNEAAMKYFMLSVFSSALTLFGFSYLYGLSGTTNLPAPPTVAIDSGDVFEGTGTAASSGGVFTIVGNCPAKSGSNAEFDCTVTVTWTESGSPRTVSVESYVTSQQ